MPAAPRCQMTASMRQYAHRGSCSTACLHRRPAPQLPEYAHASAPTVCGDVQSKGSLGLNCTDHPWGLGGARASLVVFVNFHAGKDGLDKGGGLLDLLPAYRIHAPGTSVFRAQQMAAVTWDGSDGPRRLSDRSSLVVWASFLLSAACIARAPPAVLRNGAPPSAAARRAWRSSRTNRWA